MRFILNLSLPSLHHIDAYPAFRQLGCQPIIKPSICARQQSWHLELQSPGVGRGTRPRVTSSGQPVIALIAPPCLRHRGGLGWAMRPRPGRAAVPGSPPHPTPSLLRRIGLVEKTLSPKLDMIAKFTGKFLLETGGPLAGNTMFPRAPRR